MSKQSTYHAASSLREAAELLGPKLGYLSITGAAHYAGVSTRTIKRWITRGLPAYQGSLRGKVLIKPGDIDLYLEKKPIPVAKHDVDAMIEGVLKGFRKGTESDRITKAPTAEHIGLRPRKPSQRAKWAQSSAGAN